MPRFLFDSHALLAFLQNEKRAKSVLKFLKETKKNKIDPIICMFDFGEILYMTKRRFSDKKNRIHFY